MVFLDNFAEILDNELSSPEFIVLISRLVSWLMLELGVISGFTYLSMNQLNPNLMPKEY